MDTWKAGTRRPRLRKDKVTYFTTAGYDLYRFDRQYIRDWPGDATSLVDAVKQARATWAIVASFWP